MAQSPVLAAHSGRPFMLKAFHDNNGKSSGQPFLLARVYNANATHAVISTSYNNSGTDKAWQYSDNSAKVDVDSYYDNGATYWKNGLLAVDDHIVLKSQSKGLYSCLLYTSPSPRD